MISLACQDVNIIVPTMRGLATRRAELLPDALTVVVEGAIRWTKGNRAQVWATQSRTRAVAKFPPGLVVWGPALDAGIWKVAGVPFQALPGGLDGVGLVMGPGRVPRPGDAFFGALELACTELGAKKVRVFGAFDWGRRDVRWKRWALAHCQREAARHGIEIQRVR